MNKKNQLLLIISILFMSLLVIGGSFAYWTLTSNVNKNVVFNTSKELYEYINYDEGESTFVGDFKVSDSYLDGIHSTISISKKTEISNISLTATLNMDIKSIGTNMANSSALKWVVTSGDSSNPGEVLSQGNFLGVSSGNTMMLLPNVEITTTVKKYTIWIWLDASENPDSNLTGETLDTVVWTEINQVEGVEHVFEVTKLANNYQIVNATVVNNKSNVVAYAVTSENIEPLGSNFDNVKVSPLINNKEVSVSKVSLNEWIDIPEEERNKIYNFSYIVPSSGTYYLWFRDDSGKVVSNNITIDNIYTDKPICVWGEFSQGEVKEGDASTINLTCTGDMVGNTDLTTSDITLSNNYVTLTNIEKEVIDNGYSYKITLTGTDGNGNVTLTLNNNVFMNKYNNGNDSIVTNEIIIDNTVNITYISDGEIDGGIGIENLVANGDFENDMYGWNIVNSTSAVIHSTDGINNTSFVRITPQATYKWISSSTYQIPSNNIVYNYAYYRKSGGGNTVLTSYDTSLTKGFAYYLFDGDTDTWTKLTKIGTNITDYTNFNTLIYGAASSYVEGMYTDWDNVMTIDLTKTFGSGKEPTKEWLDKNLPYIDETGSIYNVEKNIGSSFTNLPTPTREGYTFDGWYTGENGTGTKITEGSIVPNEDTTYYAKWIDSIAPTLIISGENMVSTDGLIRYYNGKNNLGNGHSSSQNIWKDLATYDGRINGGTWNSDSITLDGVDDYVSLGKINDLRKITMEIDFIPKSLSGGVLNNYNSGGYGLEFDSSKLCFLVYIDTSYKKVCTQSVLTTNTRYRITATYDNSELKLYVNGSLNNTTTGVSGMVGNPTNNTQVFLGCNPSGNACESNTYLKGDIYSVRIYNRVLSETEIINNISDVTDSSQIIKNGLLRYYDGLNNTGYGHSYDRNTWHDLSNEDAVISGGTWNSNSITLDGVDDYVSLGEVNDLNYLTLEIHMYRTSKSGYVFNNYNDGGYGLHINNAKACFQVYITDVGYKSVCTTGVTLLNASHSITGVYDGSSLKIYVNGVLENTLTGVTGTIKNPTNNTPLVFGCNPNGNVCDSGSYSGGNVYSARVYNRALSEEEIKQNMIADKISAGHNNSGENVTFDFIANESIKEFTTDDVTITNGTKGTFTKVDDSHYLLNVTLNASTTAQLDIPINSFVDLSGNYNTNALNYSIYRDVSGPVPTITVDKTDSLNVVYTITFHENVYGFTANDITLSEGTKGTFTKVDLKTFTLSVTHSTDGNKTITIPANKVYDVAGNLNNAKSFTMTFDVSGPTGSVSASLSNGVISATVNASDAGSGLATTDTYGWLLTTSSTCNSSTTGSFVTNTNKNYTFIPDDDDNNTYYVCVKVKDGNGNIGYIRSSPIEYVIGFTYNELISNYSCANSSAGSSPIFTYTGNCEVVNDGGNKWKVRFLSTGDLTFSEDIYVEAFLLGAGGYGTCDIMSAYDTWYCASGGGGYHTNIGHSLHYDSSYTLTVGEPNGGSTSAFDTTVNGGGNGKVSSANGGVKGSGGTECYEFEEETGDILYSGTHSVRGEVPPANTGRGGWHTSKTSGTTSGSSGIIVIRPKQSELSIVYNNTGGSGCGTKYAMFGDTYGELCTPVRDGYYFEGWYTSNSYTTKVESTDAIPSSATVNLYAHWIQKPGPLILFDGGDITNITGGWGGRGHKFSSGKTKVINDTQVGVYYSESLDSTLKSSFYAYTVNSIDLTLYDTLYMNITSVKGYTSNIFVHNGDIADLSGTSPEFSKSISAAVGVVSLDVSDLVGEYQIGMHTSMSGHQYGTVKYYIYADKVWLE